MGFFFKIRQQAAIDKNVNVDRNRGSLDSFTVINDWTDNDMR